MEKIIPLKDYKKEIEFWLKALSNPNINEESIVVLNKCLQVEISQYLTPVYVSRIKG